MTAAQLVDAQRRQRTDQARALDPVAAGIAAACDHLTAIGEGSRSREELGLVAKRLEQLHPRASGAKTPPDLGALCSSMPGRFLRIGTGIHGLDSVTRGGFRTANMNVIGGAPGAHKTTLLATVAYRWARDGVPTPRGRQPVLVSIVAADEARDGFMSRIGQVERISRDDLDHEDPAVSGPAWEGVAAAIRPLGDRLRIWDPREDAGVTVESAAAELAANPSDIARRVLVIDSLQALEGWGCDDVAAESKRSQIDTRMRTALGIARKHRLCVIVTSELSRAGYRTRGGDNTVNKLATFKESGGIEYAADMAFTVEPTDEDHDVIDLDVVKSRWGGAGSSIRLRRGGWLVFSEEGVPPKPTREDVVEGRIDTMTTELVERLRRHPFPITNRQDLNGLVRGERRLVVACVTRAIAEGRIVKSGTGYLPASGAE